MARLLVFMSVTMVILIFLERSSSAGSGPPCRPGNYEVRGACVPCSKPPAEQSRIYSIYCEGVCRKGNWGLYCDKNCNSGCFNDFCNRWTGYCIHGCKRIFHGKSCNIVCPTCEYCDDGEGGIGCVCFKGHYGDVCQHTCPANCKNHTCKYGGTCKWGCTRGWVGARCDVQCTHCSYEYSADYNCQIGWYGQSCNQSCIDRCVRGLCYKNGSCLDGCKDGVWGEMCDVPCPETCQQNQCHQSTGACVHGCVTGRFDGTCKSECPDRCTGGCKIDGSCLACSSGYTGHECNRTCPVGCQTCHQDIQQCTSCNPGHYGDLCQLQCGNCFNGDCDILTGSCFSECIDGWYGIFCNISCPENCKEVTGCHQDSGRCLLGCSDGWYGARCERRCSPGCKEGRCETDSGRCVKPCMASLYGVYCNNSCSNHCINTRCVHVEDTDTVVCIEGCSDGWRGPYCQEREDFPHVVPCVVLSVCLIIVILCLIRLLFRLKGIRSSQKNKRDMWYLSPTNSSVTYSTQTSSTLVTRWSRDLNDDTADVTTDDDRRAYSDNRCGYEPVNSGYGHAADDQQQCVVTSSSSQEELYMEIPSSHFT